MDWYICKFLYLLLEEVMDNRLCGSVRGEGGLCIVKQLSLQHFKMSIIDCHREKIGDGEKHI